MCGIAAIVGPGAAAPDAAGTLTAMLDAQASRGPDDRGVHVTPGARLGHLRLSIIDLSPAGHQPMASADGRYWLSFNGEIYNYLELRAELGGAAAFRTHTDTEVILAVYQRWGEAGLARLSGMFAFVLWDAHERRLLAVRDRFGVKPLHYHVRPDGTLLLASEIRGLHAGGVAPEPDPVAWATYLASGHYDHGARTFWAGVSRLPPGHLLRWQPGAAPEIAAWYRLSDQVAPDSEDGRDDATVEDEYTALLDDSIRLRLRSDVPVGINLSGGLDSSLLLALVRRALGPDAALHTFTFATGDPDYDETPWVARMLAGTAHPHHPCITTPADVPALAALVADHEDEPFGGLPTLALSRCFARARELGVIVLLDGQGLDEQWAGYDYYARAAAGLHTGHGLVQGSTRVAGAPEVLTPAFAALAEPWTRPAPHPSELVNLQLADAMFTKIPRALRFNDRVSMLASTELREPFLDHRLFELALRQPARRKLQGGVHKWLLRRIAARLLPPATHEAPKRPVQTPQREWLRGALAPWVSDQLAIAQRGFAAGWLDGPALARAWDDYRSRGGDNSFHVWQWLSLGLMTEVRSRRTASRGSR